MINELKKLGLSEYESRIVIALSKKRYNLRELSNRTKVPFGKIYTIVNELKNKDIVKELNTRPKVIYIDSYSKVIDTLIQNKKEEDKILFDRLRLNVISDESTLKKVTKDSKFFQIGVTQEDNKKIQLYAFNSAKEEVLQIINIHHRPKSNRSNKLIWEKEISNAVKRGVEFKSIYPKDVKIPVILNELNKKSPNKFMIQRLDTDFVRCDIIDSKSVLIKLVHSDAHHYGGIIYLENENFANNLRNIFFNLWNEVE